MSDNQVIPDAAVEAAAKALRDAFDWGVGDFDKQARAALEAALPYMLSHEREETRLAHLDAVVNAQTVDKLEKELAEAKAQAWDEGHKAGKSDEFAHNKGFTGYHDNPYRTAK